MTGFTVEMVGGPHDGERWVVPFGATTWRVYELLQTPVAFYQVSDPHPQNVPVLTWEMPIRKDNTVHWADRRQDAS